MHVEWKYRDWGEDLDKKLKQLQVVKPNHGEEAVSGVSEGDRQAVEGCGGDGCGSQVEPTVDKRALRGN